MIRRHKTTIFTDAKENTSVAELKRMLEGKFYVKLKYLNFSQRGIL